MRKLSILFIVLLILTISIPSTLSEPKSRIIGLTADRNEKEKFKGEGCVIIHELIDATALECPDGVSKKHKDSGKAIEDKLLSVIDSQANTQIGADSVWTSGYTGKGVTVAVLDSGVDHNHRELSSSTCGYTTQPNLCGKSFVRYTSSFFDDNGHGTHVSGAITSDGIDSMSKGVAPDARVWMGKVCSASGSCYTSDIAAGIEYIALNNVAKIMNISLGGGGTSGSNCNYDYLASKVNWAVTNYAVTAVIAAGNSGSVVSSPACASSAISVGAVDKSDVRPYWSGSGNALKISAPGVNIYSTLLGNSYASWSGTSMATPHISATIALIKQKNSALTDSNIKNALYTTAKDLGASGWDRYYGWGRVDALAAVNAVSGGGSPPPFNFSVSVNLNNASVTQGGSVAPAVTVSLLSGTTQQVSLSALVSPSTATMSTGFSPSNGNPTFTSSLTIGTTASTPVGTYTISVTGNGGGITRSTSFALTVTANSKISVSTVDSANNPIVGYYTTLWQNGVMLKWAYSPALFTVNGGQTYQVAVADYGTYYFDHWSDGTTNRFHAVTTVSGTTTYLVAVYRTTP